MICCACGKETEKLVVHHWYEPPRMKRMTRRICFSCNSILRTDVFYPKPFYRSRKNSIHHILPNWEEQLEKLHKILRLRIRRQQRKTQTRAIGIRIPVDILMEGRAVAKEMGISFNQFINRVIIEELERDEPINQLVNRAIVESLRPHSKKER